MGNAGKVTKQKIILTKTERFLLGVTALFAAFLLVTVFAGRDGNSYTVQPQRRSMTVQEETVWQIDLNTADSEQLQQLEGIGPVLAERIVEYRETHGAFGNVEELLDVEGIGEKVLDGFRDMVIVEGRS